MTDTPQLLLAHHLKALRLPTFLRAYDKVPNNARQKVSIIPVIFCASPNWSSSTGNGVWSNGGSKPQSSRPQKPRQL